MSRTLRPTAKVLPEYARRHNRAMVLQRLFHHGPSSRADLARETALARVTVSDLIGDLLAEELVEELGVRAESRVGKPATLVGLRPDAAHIICLDLSDETCFLGAVLDIAGNVLQRRSVPLKRRTAEAALACAVELTRDLVALATRPVLGVGVGSPGVVDPDGVVLQAPNLGWEQLALRAELADAVNLPVHVANDANTAAMGEHTFGGAEGSGLMLIRIGRGMGAGLLLDGALLSGHHYAAGEIGHVTVEERGSACACGRRGCLETVVAAPALRAAIAGADERATNAALASGGRRLGMALAPIVSALDLREVVLSGPPELLTTALMEAALATIRKRTMPLVGESLDLRMAFLGADVVLAGAAVLVLSGELGVS